MEPNHTEHRLLIERKLIMRSILVVLFLLVGCIAWFIHQYTSTVLTNIRGEAITPMEAGIDRSVRDRINRYDNQIKNILLIGIDRNNDPADPSRSDTMMILSVDDQHNSLKLSSLMRDTHVKISGHGTTKLNHAYAYGGVKLLMKTVNTNFDLDIEDYVMVDFHDMISIINAVDGIDVDIKENEIEYINNGIRNLNNLEGTQIPYVETPGLIHLDGTQATSYARIRSTKGGDYARTERQRLVLKKVYDKVRTASLVDLPNYIAQLSPFVKTSLTYDEIFDLGLKVLTEEFSIKGTHFPTVNTSEEISKSEWYIKMDKPATVDELHDYIYRDIPPQNTETFLQQGPSEGQYP